MTAARIKRIFCLGLTCLLGLALVSSAWAEDYHPGQGQRLGNFLISGYANIVAESPQDGPAKLSIDDLSLFVSGRVNRWLNPFLETEVSSATLLQSGDGPLGHGRLIMERFYDDLRLSESDTLRIGKILAPVGDWNLIHAAPLVPTTTRPMTTQHGFSEYANGFSWLRDPGTGAGPDWQIYWQPGREWLPRPSIIAPEHYRNIFGAHINWSSGLSDKIGLSFQQGRSVNADERYRLFGFNVRRSIGRLNLESEATSTQWSGTAARIHDRESGLYALADYALDRHWHGILEWEHFQSRRRLDPSRNTLLGFAYKPQPALVWKLEYVHQTGDAYAIPTGWLGSFAVLF